MALVIRDLPHEYVVAAQRRRAVEAVAEIAHEFGLAGVTTAAVCRIARMARATYYRLFEGAGGCLRYSFAESYRLVLDPMAEADGDSDRRSSIGSKVAALHASVAANPLLAELCLVHSYGAPEEAAGHDFEAAVDDFANQLAGARAPEERHLVPVAADYLARAILSHAARRARQGEVSALISDSRSMTALVGAYQTAVGETKRP